MSKGSLYYSPTSCGAANFITAFKAGVVDKELTASVVQNYVVLDGEKKGAGFKTINPKGMSMSLMIFRQRPDHRSC
jgi:hypothetical protein